MSLALSAAAAAAVGPSVGQAMDSSKPAYNKLYGVTICDKASRVKQYIADAPAGSVFKPLSKNALYYGGMGNEVGPDSSFFLAWEQVPKLL